MTRWGKKVNKTNIHKEYPRSRMVRDSYLNLNGEWEYAITEANNVIQYDGTILVPFSPETKLSGVEQILQPEEYLHYKRKFKLPRRFNEGRILLHFGAVDQECEVYLNGHSVGNHKGGYLPFYFDITDVVESYSENTLEVRVMDKTEFSPHARGKQKLNSKDKMDAIFYTPNSGIWKTVWIESVPDTYIEDIKVTPNFDEESVTFEIMTNRPSRRALIEISLNYEPLQQTRIQTNRPVTIQLDEMAPWSPESPKLYDVRIHCQQDQVHTYFGMRKFSKKKDINGIDRFYLNNKPYFINGLLDQGYWPESLLTPPSDEALKFDIVETKKLGFNTIRKHVKIESERFYYHCDRLGMLVIQDMPNGGDDISKPFMMYLPNVSDKLSRKINDNRYKWFGRSDAEGRVQYKKDLKNMVNTLYSHPSIAMWVPFNEGWGQFDAREMTKIIREIDNQRLIAETSGWFDQGGGDFYTIHNYLKKLKVKPKPDRIVALMEYGGYALPVENHLQTKTKFGYRTYRSSQDLKKNYQALWENQILPQVANGLSATIYTQTTDVEGEINGLFTYDREMLKMDAEVIQIWNHAVYHLFDSLTTMTKKDSGDKGLL